MSDGLHCSESFFLHSKLLFSHCTEEIDGDKPHTHKRGEEEGAEEWYLVVLQIQDVQFGQALQAAHLVDSETNDIQKEEKYYLSQCAVSVAVEENPK